MDAALSIYESLYNRFPNSQLVVNNLVLTLIKKGDMEKAKNILEEFLNKKRKVSRVSKTRLLSNLIILKYLIHLMLGNVEEAINYFNEKLSEEFYICSPDWEELPNLEFDLETFFRINDDELSKFQWSVTYSKHSEYILPLSENLRLLIYKIVKKRLAENGNDKNVTRHLKKILAIVALSLGKIKEAKLMAEALTEEDRDFYSLVVRGKIRYVINDLNGAYQDFLEALKMAENTNQRHIPLANLSVIFMRTGDYEKALELINEALRSKVDCYLCWYIRAMIYLRSEKWIEAEKAFKAILEWRKDDGRIWYGLGITYLARNKLLESIECFLKAMKLDPTRESSKLYLDLARAILEGRGDK